MDDLHRDDTESTDAAGASADEPIESGSRERPVDRIRRSSAGAVVAAGLLGLRDALEGRPEKEEIAIVNDAPDAPPHDALEVSIDFDHPERSVAIIRRPHGETEL